MPPAFAFGFPELVSVAVASRGCAEDGWEVGGVEGEEGVVVELEWAERVMVYVPHGVTREEWPWR